MHTTFQEFRNSWLYVRTCACSTDLRSEIETSSREYRGRVRDLSKEERKQRLNKIQELFKKAMEYSDDKVQIAMQMYEMVSQS